MEDIKNDNQVLNGDDVNTSGDGQPQYSETEKQLYTRLKKEEAEKKSLKAELEALKSNNDGQQKNIPDIEWKERMELIARGFNDDADLDFIMKMGGKKALEDSYVKMALDKKKEEKKANESVAMNISSKSSIERRYSSEEIRSMSASDMEKALSGQKI